MVQGVPYFREPFGTRRIFRPRRETPCVFDGTSSGQVFNTDNVDLNDGMWHFVVVQNDGATTEIYIDGQFDISISETLFKLSSSDPDAKTYLGISRVEDERLNGIIDNLKVYDDALSQQNIDTLFSQGPSTLGLGAQDFMERISIYPNPSHTFLMIDHLEKNWNNIKILTSSGQIVLTQELRTGKINIENIAIGTYTIWVGNNKGDRIAQERFIKK